MHEAYLRLVGQRTEKAWNGRGHFFGAAAEAMRRILVENAQAQARQRHGGGLARVDLDRIDLADDEASDELLAINEALDRLAGQEPTVAEVVKFRHFAGLTIERLRRHWAFRSARPTATGPMPVPGSISS